MFFAIDISNVELFFVSVSYAYMITRFDYDSKGRKAYHTPCHEGGDSLTFVKFLFTIPVFLFPLILDAKCAQNAIRR